MKMEILENQNIGEESLVSVKKMGNIVEVCHISKKNNSISTIKIDKDYYMDLKTGEIKACKHIENRSQNKLQISQSLKRLREYVNTNITDPNKCLWVTLTYAENMTDPKTLYIDFKNFIKRFRYKYGKSEYIVACEPQKRGAWHCHVIFIFDTDAPFVPNKIMRELWQKGFTKTNNLKNIDNIGAYLSAYLGDATEEDFRSLGINCNFVEIKEVNEINGKELKKPKKFVKGGRLYMYPPNFNLYRISKGIKKPEKEYMSYHVAKEKIGLGQPTYKKALKLTQDNFNNTIIYEYYNLNRK